MYSDESLGLGVLFGFVLGVVLSLVLGAVLSTDTEGYLVTLPTNEVRYVEAETCELTLLDGTTTAFCETNGNSVFSGEVLSFEQVRD